ncbi:MAG: radical SAM protein [Nitrospina sp.]|nr:radical SAM protein [Nitrospina sp.]
MSINLGAHQAAENFKKDCIDYVFLGEADLTILELIERIEQGEPFPENIEGLVCNHDGKYLLGINKTALVPDLDQLPLFDLEQYYDLSHYYPPIHIRGNKVINTISVRGCPYPCTFCAVAAINGTNMRKVSIPRFVDNIELYMKKGYDSFMIYDDTFTIIKRRAIEFCREILKRKLKFVWNCWSRVDRLDDETLSLMREAGCYLIMFGCESMNEKTLLKLKKGYPVEQNLAGIEMAKKNGLLTSSSFMIGLPGETKEDIQHTIDVVCNKSQLDFAVFPVFEPYQGTPIYEDCEKEGRWLKDERYKNRLLVEQEAVWEPYSASRENIEKLARMAFRKFYLRPSYIFNFRKIFKELPSERKRRLIASALDYFVLSRFSLNTGKSIQVGDRYK